MKRQSTMAGLARWALLATLVGVGMVAFLMLVGEETPDNPMTLGEFFVLKFGALATPLRTCADWQAPMQTRVAAAELH